MSRFTCPECGRSHDELPVYGFEAPILWSAADEESRKADFELGSELCRYKDSHYMIRGRLFVPVHDEPTEPLEFGVWVVVSKENFDRYAAAYATPNASSLGRFYGWLANRIPGYDDTVNLKLEIQPQDNMMRPFLAVVPTEHDLYRQQQEGVPAEQAMRWLHTHGGF